MRPGPSQDEIRRRNLGALLRHVHVHGPASRAELTAALGLNRSTIGALTADLVAAGLVSEGAPRETGRAGRPSPVVRPESRVYALGLSVETDRLRAARIGLGGELLDQREIGREPGMSAKEVAPLLATLVTRLRADLPGDAVCAGVAAAVGGLVRRDDGVVRLAPHLGWVDEPLGEALGTELELDRPVAVGNFADLAALGEHTRGVATGCDDVIYLHGADGIGAGIIAGGRPVTGHGGYGGEVGHMVVRPGGQPCSCGSRGCWESEIGAQALLRAAGMPDARGPAAVRALLRPVGRNATAAQAAVREAGDWLGFGVANLVNLFNPQMVVFGGTLRDVYLASATRVRSRLTELALGPGREQLRLRTPQLGEDAALVGAAELAFAPLLADPLDAA